jgi:Mrp family chromosome partitioning ATPase
VEPQATAGRWGVLTLEQLEQELEEYGLSDRGKADELPETPEEGRVGATDPTVGATESGAEPDTAADEARGRLVLITSGAQPADPPAMFSAPALPELLERLAAEHDLVIIDSPPMLAVSDAVHLMSVVDGTVLVSRVGSSTREDGERVLALTDRVPNATVLGLVLNDLEDGGRGGLYRSS